MDQEKQLEQLLERTFDGLREGLRDEVGPTDYERLRRDFVFHMIDWKSDLEQLAALFERPYSFKENEASALVVGFLYHVIPHLKAAGQLLLDDVGDPFADEDVFGVLQKVAYWGVVEDCLVQLHGLKKPSAHGKTNRYRREIEDKASGIVSNPVGLREPFRVACELAGVNDADEQDRLLSLNAAEYQSICRYRGWRTACFAGH